MSVTTDSICSALPQQGCQCEVVIVQNTRACLAQTPPDRDRLCQECTHTVSMSNFPRAALLLLYTTSTVMQYKLCTGMSPLMPCKAALRPEQVRLEQMTKTAWSKSMKSVHMFGRWLCTVLLLVSCIVCSDLHTVHSHCEFKTSRNLLRQLYFVALHLAILNSKAGTFAQLHMLHWGVPHMQTGEAGVLHSLLACGI